MESFTLAVFPFIAIFFPPFLFPLYLLAVCTFYSLVIVFLPSSSLFFLHFPVSPSLSSLIYVSRYKVLCKDHSEFLKLWPGYVYWARGQVKLALSAFSTALDSLKYGKHTSNLWLGWLKNILAMCILQ